MSQGTPVVGTRGGGVPEIIEHGMSGFMYEIGNIDELGHYIRQVLDDQVIWTLFSLNGQEEQGRCSPLSRHLIKFNRFIRSSWRDPASSL